MLENRESGGVEILPPSLDLVAARKWILSIVVLDSTIPLFALSANR
jgi:hypothetical protein